MCSVNQEVKEEVKEENKPIVYGRTKIFVRHIWGVFQQKRWIAFTFFATLFYLLPWIRINGRQPLLFDIPARKFHILTVTIWPQEIYLLTLTLITAAIGLFFSTAVVGRVWCGYLCPQTVFTSIFIEIERLILGDRPAQMKLAKAPMSFNKFSKLMIRNSVWGILAVFTGFTFMSYFIPNTDLFNRILSGELNGWALFWFILISGFTFFDAGFFREQFCLVPCPYGRFQGALQDPNSLVVTYDKKRGEGDKSKGVKGDCINCNLCVQVCPTGIDIRDGAQFECIGCARCIDVCSVVQEKKGRSPDLIKYASENEMKGLPTKIIRPRLLIYVSIMTFLVSFILFKIITRPGFDIEITRNRNLMYQKMTDGSISNMYFIKVLNMSEEEQMYMIKLKDIEGSIVTGENPMKVKSGDVHDTTLTVISKPVSNEAISKFSLILERIDEKGKGRSVEERTTFLYHE